MPDQFHSTRSLLEAQRRALAIAGECDALRDQVRVWNESPARQIMEQVRRDEASRRALLPDLAQVERARSMSLAATGSQPLARYLDIVSQTSKVAEASKLAMAPALEAQNAMRALLEPARATRALLDSAIGDQLVFAQTINRQFDLRLQKATIAALGVAAAAEAARSLFPPGYQAVAMLGLQGSVARGLVADVLRHYGEEVPETPLFASALESAAIADTQDMSEDQAVAFLRTVGGWIIELIQDEADVIRRNGLSGVLGLILGLLAIHISSQQLQVARASVASSPTKADIAAVFSETRAVYAELQADHQDRVERDRQVRYVHDRAPLRAEPDGRAIMLRIVYPDQLLRVIDERGEWLMVEVFDYQSDSPMRGWISRRRVRLQPLP